jgi:hypothetical protein
MGALVAGSVARRIGSGSIPATTHLGPNERRLLTTDGEP